MIVCACLFAVQMEQNDMATEIDLDMKTPFNVGARNFIEWYLKYYKVE